MLVFVGMTASGTQVQLDGPIMIRQEKTIAGSFHGTTHNPPDFVKFSELFVDGLLPRDDLITKRYPLEGIIQANQDMPNGELGPGVLTF